jgi:DnaJ family protein A protein 2
MKHRHGCKIRGMQIRLRCAPSSEGCVSAAPIVPLTACGGRTSFCVFVQLLVSSNEGEIVKPGAFKAVFDEGMPDWQRSFDKGKLFVHFNVKFPEPGDIADADVSVLEKVLGPRPALSVDMDNCEEVSAMDVDMEQEMRRQQQQQQQQSYDDDDDHPGGQQRVQCAQQ